ncbi:hypothetical protein DICVIV_00549 [Dictyocaulus viviparus]|uniref:Uncharacterized protein n=1 Tax=Dictyocaulus viviparus TaxID=29172 RepID=A0A0D8Y8U1_DICVI|nr:hypothetical protein DICVIV_00549 [Dictyocaulus viviparus]
MEPQNEPIWKFSYVQKRFNDPVDFVPVLRHPLLPPFLLSNESAAHDSEEMSKYDFIDPLGATAKDELEKNLTQLDLDALEDISSKKDHILDNTLETKNKDGPLPNFDSWSNKRTQILNVNIESDKAISSGTPGHAKLFVNNRTRYRLEILDDMSGLRRLSEVSQNEFVSHVNELRELLITAWQDNKRIEAVRLVTELARLLSAPTTPSFFPVQWIIVTDILDMFGKLVYDRLFCKANEERKAAGYPALLSNFFSRDILPQTTEIAKNWFCKISDIKEVIPRFYVESTLIECLRFLDSDALRINLLRLTKMVEKFPHPLSAAYARAYICKISMILEPTDRAPHWKALNDWMQSPRQPVEFFEPALEWIVQCVSYGATTIEDLGPLWEYCKHSEQRVSLFNPFVTAVSLKYLLNYCLEMCEIIVSQNRPSTDLEALFARLLQGEIPDSVRPKIYRYFSAEELSELCDSTFEKLQCSFDTYEHLVKLAAMIECIVGCEGEDLLTLLRTKSFIGILDYIRDEPYGSKCAKALLSTLIRSFPVAFIDDLYIVNQVRIIERIVSSALDRASLYKDPERHLAFLIRARSCLYQSDNIVAHIITLMTSFGFHFFNHSISKKASFVRVIIANLFITIPSLNDPIKRLQSSLQTVHLSLLINCLSQTEALMLFCLETLQELTVPPQHLLSMYAQFLALLVYVPDVPQKPVLFLFDSFTEIVQRRKWSENVLLGDAWILCLHYLWAVSHSDFPVKFINVQSNDVYYGSSDAYRAKVMEKVDFVMHQLLSLIEEESPTKPSVALSLLEFSVIRLSIVGPVVKLVSNLLKRCAKSGQFQSRVIYVIKNLTKLAETNEELHSALVKMKLLLH